MPTLTIEGRQVNVDDSFTSLTPDQQNATVDEIAKSMPSVWGGRLKQAGVGLAKGVIGIPGMVGDIGHLMDLGFSKIDRMRGVPEEEIQRKLDIARNVPLTPPTSHDIQSQVEKVTGEFRKPQTTAEKYIDTVAQFIPATISPASGIVNAAKNAVKYGVAPAVASEAAGQAVEGTPYEPWVRAGTALATGLGVAGASGLVTRPSAAERIIRGAVPENITPQQLNAAEQLFQEAHAAGQPITRAEAIQHVTQKGTSLGNVQRVVEGMGELRPTMSERPAANEAAARDLFDTVTPQTNQPSMIGRDIGEAAEKTVRDIERARTNAVEPLYTAANSDKVPAKEMRGFVKEIDKQIKSDKTGIIGEALQEVRDLLTRQKKQPGKPAEVILQDASVPEPFATANPVKEVIPAVKRKNELIHTDIESLDRIRKYVREKIDMPQIGADAITKEQGAGVTKLLDDLRQKMIDASPNFQQGNQLYQDITKKYLDPLMAGPIGKIAKRDTTTQQAIEALFPAKGLLPGSEHEVSTAVASLAMRNPEAAKKLVRAHAEMVFDQATKNNIPGANEFGGAKFAVGIRGNPQQAKNLEAAIRALPNGNKIYEGFDRFLNFVEAQGKRQPIGSQTAFNQSVISDLEKGTTLQEAGNAALTGGVKLPATVKETFDRWRLGRNTKDLADLLTSPSESGRFIAIAQMPSGSEQARRVMLKLVLTAAQGARSGTE